MHIVKKLESGRDNIRYRSREMIIRESSKKSRRKSDSGSSWRCSSKKGEKIDMKIRRESRTGVGGGVV